MDKKFFIQVTNVASMFIKGNNSSDSQETEARTYRERTLFPILKPSALLQNAQRQRVLRQIETLTQLEEEYYQALYLPLIEDFARFVQVIPVTPGGRLGGLLNEGLRRGLLILQTASEQQGQESPNPQFLFAAFSAALLYDVDKVLAQQKVMISNKKGEFISVWLPYEGYMEEFGSHYKMRGYGGSPVRISPFVTPILARQIMPKEGFLWLAQNYQLLNMWLATLGGDEGNAGGLGHLLSIVKKLLHQAKARGELLPEVEVELIEPAETEAAEDFHEWLKSGIADGSISVNKEDSLVHVVEEGVFIDPAIVKQFFNAYPDYRKEFDFLRLYGHLGIGLLRGEELRHFQYSLAASSAKGGGSAFSQFGKGLLSGGSEKRSVRDSLKADAKNIKQGFIIPDSRMVFDKEPPPVNGKMKAIAKVAAALAASVFIPPIVFDKPRSFRPGR